MMTPSNLHPIKGRSSMQPSQSNNQNHKPHHHHIGEDTIIFEVLSAALGGAFSSACLYPLEVIKKRMMDNNYKNDNEDDIDNIDPIEGGKGLHKGEGKEDATRKLSTMMIGFARHLFRTEGGAVFYIGWKVSAIQSVIEK
jgi:Mitochondrial carrier protein